MENFKVSVMRREKAKRFSFGHHSEKTIIISITDISSVPNSFNRSANNGIKDILKIQFDDVNYGESGCITYDDAKKIVDFIKRWSGRFDHLIVHCEAGLSRSAGVAAAVSMYMMGHDSGILGSNKYSPNMTCYEMVLNEFLNTKQA